MFLLLKIDDRPSKDLKICKVAPLCCLPVHGVVQHISEHVLPCRRTALLFLVEMFPILAIFLLLQQKYVTRTSFVWFAFTLSASQVFTVKKCCGLVNVHIFHHFLPLGRHFLLLVNHFWRHPHILIRIVLALASSVHELRSLMRHTRCLWKHKLSHRRQR